MSIKIISKELLETSNAKWIKLLRINYRDPKGTQRTWESAERTTRRINQPADGVGILAVLKKSTGPELLLQRQSRPPVDGICIEVPAGLIDEGETAEQCAVRELKEETGYIGTVTQGKSPLMFNDPGFCNTNLHVVHVDIDLSLEANKNPQPELEESEFIETFSVPLKDLYKECKRMESEGLIIDARVGTLAEGIEMAKKWNIT